MLDRNLVEAFADRVEAGDFLGAIEDYYAPDASMQENLDPPREGRERLLEHERRVLAGMATMRASRAGPVLVAGDHAAIQWRFAMVTAEGRALELDEVAWQTWRDGRIVAERFYYDPKQLQG